MIWDTLKISKKETLTVSAILMLLKWKGKNVYQYLAFWKKIKLFR